MLTRDLLEQIPDLRGRGTEELPAQVDPVDPPVVQRGVQPPLQPDRVRPPTAEAAADLPSSPPSPSNGPKNRGMSCGITPLALPDNPLEERAIAVHSAFVA